MNELRQYNEVLATVETVRKNGELVRRRRASGICRTLECA